VAPDRQGKHQRLLPNNFSDTPNSFTQVYLFGTQQSDRLTFQSSINQRRAHYVDEVLNSKWSDGLFFKTNQSEKGKSMQCVAKMIEHVIASTVNNASFDHCVVEA
jgi:hypothetical protein